MVHFWHKVGAIGFGAFTPALGYILVVENVLPEWAVFAVIAGGIYGTGVSVLEGFSPFEGVRRIALNLLVVFGLFLPFLVHSEEAFYVYSLSGSIVISASLFQHVLRGAFGSNGRDG